MTGPDLLRARRCTSCGETLGGRDMVYDICRDCARSECDQGSDTTPDDETDDDAA